MKKFIGYQGDRVTKVGQDSLFVTNSLCKTYPFAMLFPSQIWFCVIQLSFYLCESASWFSLFGKCSVIKMMIASYYIFCHGCSILDFMFVTLTAVIFS